MRSYGGTYCCRATASPRRLLLIPSQSLLLNESLLLDLQSSCEEPHEARAILLIWNGLAARHRALPELPTAAPISVDAEANRDASLPDELCEAAAQTL